MHDARVGDRITHVNVKHIDVPPPYYLCPKLLKTFDFHIHVLGFDIKSKYFPVVRNRTWVIRIRTEYPNHIDCKTSLEIK